MSSPTLFGAELFRAAARAMGEWDGAPTIVDSNPWAFAGTMIQWLRDHGGVTLGTLPLGFILQSHINDTIAVHVIQSQKRIPECLARLVLSVAEIERGAS